ncbi:MAG: hypothetical protein ACLQOO_13515 [Terriglobia bacterium]
MHLLAAGVDTVGLAPLWSRLLRWRRKSPEEVERLRRLDVNRRGRITTGHVTDLVEQPSACKGERLARLILYKYEVAGVTYEAAQDVSSLPDAAWDSRGVADQTASVKYDPKRPTNSIIACEEWHGIPEAQGVNSE